MSSMASNSEIKYHDPYFVLCYLGQNLERYVLSSLQLLRKSSNVKCLLIANESTEPVLKKYVDTFIPLESFYQPDFFIDTSKKYVMPFQYRSGFWFKTLERFFVLEQFAKASNLNSFLHLELDQLAFDLHDLYSKLSQTQKLGMFIPFQDKTHAIASILYCNNIATLTSFLSFANSSSYIENEMRLLADWAALNSSSVFALPTAATVLHKSRDVPTGVMAISPIEIGGIVDAAQLGQWIGGIDPRNVPLPKVPETRYFYDYRDSGLTLEELQNIKFNYYKESQRLICQLTEEQSFKLFNLHLHSKTHKSVFSSRPSLTALFEAANQKRSLQIVEARKLQIIYNVSIKLQAFVANPTAKIDKVLRNINKLLGLRLSSYPFISGDTFRSIADFVFEGSSFNNSPQIPKTGDVIFCTSDLLEMLVDDFLSHTKESFVILLGNSDRNFTANEYEVLRRTGHHYVFAQNLESYFEGVEVLPVGLENRWIGTNGKLSRIRKNRKNLNSKNKLLRIMVAFSDHSNFIERSAAKIALRFNDAADEFSRLSPSEYFKTLRKYAFSASPPGRGLESHRTWESLYFGCIPIVKSSYMNKRFKDLGIPLILVDNYEELKSFQGDKLTSLLSNNFQVEEISALWFEYWNEEIRNKQILLKSQMSLSHD